MLLHVQWRRPVFKKILKVPNCFKIYPLRHLVKIGPCRNHNMLHPNNTFPGERFPAARFIFCWQHAFLSRNINLDCHVSNWSH